MLHLERSDGARSLAKLIALACLTMSNVADSEALSPQRPTFVTTDVDRFYRLYDSTHGHPAAADLQRLYIDAGSAGLHDFAAVRGLTGVNLAAAIDKDSAPFEEARRCVAALPSVRARLAASLGRMRHIYPKATFPPITVLIGRTKTGGTTSKTGVLIGIETLCSVGFLEENREDRLVHIIAHEFAHVQQPGAEEADQRGSTVLFASLIEGGAEFVGELTSGGVSYPHLRAIAKGREREVLDRFVTDRDKTDLSNWLYNGLGSPKAPGDLGYWAGYKVVKAYYKRTRDKRRALIDILQVTPQTASIILQKSGIVNGGRTDRR
jgi:hypothetical protein